jgi:hypothetical protein
MRKPLRQVAAPVAEPATTTQHVLLLLVAALAVALSVSFRIYEKDFWQHLAVGRAIWQLHAVPTRELWTWPTYGAPDVNSSWGFRALIWPLWHAAGVPGLFVWRWVTTLLVFGLALASARRMGARGFAPYVVMVLCSLSYRQRSQIRPETLASVWLALTIWILEWRRSRQSTDAAPAKRGFDPAFLLVPVFFAWANSHLSFPLGFAVLAAHALEAAISRRGDAGRLCLAGVAAVACMMLNPFGWRALAQPFQYFFGGQHETIYRIIPELWPIDLRFQLQNLFPLVLVGWPVLAIARWRRSGMDRVELALAALFLTLPFVSQRFIGFAMVAAAPYLARDLDEALRRVRPARWMRAAWTRAAVAAACCALIGLPEWTRPEFPLGVSLRWEEYPVAACDFIAREGVTGRGFNAFYYGGYLLYRFWPDRGRLPFMDIHQAGTPEDRELYARTTADASAFSSLDGRYQFDWVLWHRKATYGDHVLDALDADSSFALVFLDDAAALYLRRMGSMATRAQRLGYRELPAGEAGLASLGRAALADSIRRGALMAELERQVVVSPFHSMALVQLGSLSLATGDLPSARKDLLAALVVDPRASRVHDRLGWIALKSGDPREALREFEAEKRLRTNPPRLELGIGKSWQALGDTRRAQQAYERELIANPTSLEARDSLASVGVSN